ncbi:P-loop containing nucleoside triphosphate hydrolase protein [Ganoderma leucocontextum]|nr:P-loop containing nucleoside triphosphate hydrolase protein [Ganoderma leucocontextum]
MRRFLSLRGTSRPARSESEKGAPPHVPPPGVRAIPPSSPFIPVPLPGPYQSRNRRGEWIVHEDGPEDDEQSTAPLVTPSAPPPPPNLKVKRVDYFYSTWSRTWKYRNTAAKVRPDGLKTVGNGGDDGNDPWQSFCFVVVRKLPQPGEDKDKDEPTYQVVVKSPYLLIALKDVIQKVPGVSWTAEPLELDPYLLLTFLPRFEEYRRNLEQKVNRTTEQGYILRPSQSSEITYDTLFAVFVPRTTVVAECPVSGEPRAFELVSAHRSETNGGAFELLCESVDALDEPPSSSGAYGAGVFNPVASNDLPVPVYYPPPSPSIEPVDAVLRRAGGKTYGRVQHRMYLTHFKGTVKISSLDVYPIAYHPQAGFLEQALTERGRKWVSLRGIHHMQYSGAASYTVGGRGVGKKQTMKYEVKARVMIDRGTFKRMNPNYEMPIIKPEGSAMQNTDEWGNYHPQPVPPNNPMVQTFQARNKVPRDTVELTQAELMLTPPLVYGFSLADKTWLEFNIQHVQPIVWNDEAFENLVLPDDRKDLLKSLVESHNSDSGFDDFVEGKGHGLVINLFGPPGVGKTLSAEATSEHVRRPLYVVGGGDLGTKAHSLDQALNSVLDIATSWNAIVLIDEADVFLEQRSLHDMERNAMVAVFLRHVEYYRGILFMTTNRVKAFDEAFLSRIHVALHFQELTQDARRQVWTAFLKKVGIDVPTFGAHLVDALAARPVNGRQIKNAVRTASSLAASKKVPLSFKHLTDTLDTMDEFTEEVKGVART